MGRSDSDWQAKVDSLAANDTRPMPIAQSSRI